MLYAHVGDASGRGLHQSTEQGEDEGEDGSTTQRAEALKGALNVEQDEHDTRYEGGDDAADDDQGRAEIPSSESAEAYNTRLGDEQRVERVQGNRAAAREPNMHAEGHGESTKEGEEKEARAQQDDDTVRGSSARGMPRCLLAHREHTVHHVFANDASKRAGADSYSD